MRSNITSSSRGLVRCLAVLGEMLCILGNSKQASSTVILGKLPKPPFLTCKKEITQAKRTIDNAGEKHYQGPGGGAFPLHRAGGTQNQGPEPSLGSNLSAPSPSASMIDPIYRLSDWPQIEAGAIYPSRKEGRESKYGRHK